MVGRQQCVALGGVALVGDGQLCGVDGGLGLLHPARRLQPAHRLALGVADQPVQRRHRRGVGQQRPVADDHRVARLVAHHDLVAASRLAAQEGDDPRVLVGHRRFFRRRRVNTHSRNSTAPTAGPTRRTTDPPAVASRSTGCAGTGSNRRTAAGSAGTAGAGSFWWGVSGLEPGNSPPERGSGAAPASTSASSRSTNWSSNLALTSASTPRPNWATLPVTARSVTTCTAVPSPSAVSVAVMVALALPWPRVSRPSARSTARWASSSRSTNVALPLYCAVMGPTFTLTTPRYSSPSISCSSAPGMHGAMRSTSVSTAHACATGTLTRNSLVSSIAAGPPGCQRRRARHRTLLRPRGRAAAGTAPAPPRRPWSAAAATPTGPGAPAGCACPRTWPSRSAHPPPPPPATPRRAPTAGRPSRPLRRRARRRRPPRSPPATRWPGLLATARCSRP